MNDQLHIEKEKTELQAKRNTNWMAWLAILLAIAAFVDIHVWSAKDRNSTEVYAKALAGLQENFQQFQNTVDNAIKKNDETLSTLEEKVEQHQAALSELFSTKERNKTLWALNELNNLVDLANINLTIHHDVPAAIHLLTMAKQETKAFSDPLFQPLKQALSNDIATLQSLNQMDMDSLLDQLSTIENQIDNLPNPDSSIKQSEQNAPETISVPQNKPLWKKYVDASLAEFRRMINVRHEKDPSAFVIPEERLYLTEKIKLSIEEAKWAVIHYRPATYHAALHRAILLVSQFDAPSQQILKSTLDTLNRLNASSVLANLPSISQSLNAIEELNSSFSLKPDEKGSAQ